MKTPFKIPLLATGVPHLDPILGGGLPEYSVTILAGLAGTGKTTLAQQIAFALGTRERPAIIFGALAEPIFKILRYQQQYRFFDPAKVGKTVHFVDLSTAAIKEGAQGALRAIQEHVERLNPALVVVDSFRTFEELPGSSGGRRLFAYNLALSVASWQCTGILVAEYAERDVGFGPEFTAADNVLYLSQDLHQNSVVRKMRVVKVRGLPMMPGRHAFRITHDGLQLFSRLPAVEPAPRQKKGPRAAFGVEGLDEMMRGGVPRGQVCLVAGSSGTGKTLLALHFAVEGARRGEPCVLMTFEESPNEHAEKMAAFGWDLRALERKRLIETVSLRPVDLTIDEVLNSLHEAVLRIRAKRVIVNSISGLEIALAPTEREELREGLYRMSSHLATQGIVVLLTTEVPDLLGDVRISTQGTSFLADNVVLLRYVEINSELRRALMVMKMRTSSHDSAMREYRIGNQGVVVEKSFKDYFGVLTGVPTLRTLLEPHPYTAGLSEREEALMHTLLALKQATAADLSKALSSRESETSQALSRLVDTGYVVEVVRRSGPPSYKIALVAPATAPTRRTH